jgi:opacity protein-like surface antigen
MIVEQAPEYVPEYVPVEIGNGWYLRGDVSYSFSNRLSGGVDNRLYDPASGSYSNGRFSNPSIGSDFGYGVGAGYQFFDWLRADATVDTQQISFSGATNTASPCVPPASGDRSWLGTTCRTSDGADANAWAFMANAYADLGTYAKFTPYVGAGAGFSLVNWSNLDKQRYCQGALCPATNAGTASYGGQSDWRFTWQLMAGIAYDVTKNLKLDLGYRYRRIAGGDMHGWDVTNTSLGATGGYSSDKGYSQHAVNVGLRYSLW